METKELSREEIKVIESESSRTDPDQSNDFGYIPNYEKIAGIHFFPTKWLQEFSNVGADYRGLRRSIWADTEFALTNMMYMAEDKENIVSLDQKKLKRGVRTTQCDYHIDHLRMVTAAPQQDRVQIEVVNDDCLEAARTLMEEAKLLGEEYRVGVLNMASDARAGGGYRNGAGAQEENIFRRSNLIQHLENTERWCRHPAVYPLREFSVVYSPDVAVFRGPESEGYPFLAEPYYVDVLSAAYRRPELVAVDYSHSKNTSRGCETECASTKQSQSNARENCAAPVRRKSKHKSFQYGEVDRNCKSTGFGRDAKNIEFKRTSPRELQLTPQIADRLKFKIYTLLHVAETRGIDYLVLSAWGCGAFGNPPNHVAQLFKEVIGSYFSHSFTKIVFAIIEDHNSRGEGNLAPFQRAFCRL